MDNVVKVTSGDAEWNLLKQGSLYVLYYISVRLSPNAVRKYLTLPID